MESPRESDRAEGGFCLRGSRRTSAVARQFGPFWADGPHRLWRTAPVASGPPPRCAGVAPDEVGHSLHRRSGRAHLACVLNLGIGVAMRWARRAHPHAACVGLDQREHIAPPAKATCKRDPARPHQRGGCLETVLVEGGGWRVVEGLPTFVSIEEKMTLIGRTGNTFRNPPPSTAHKGEICSASHEGELPTTSNVRSAAH